jgi:hypothetical protein
MISSNQIFQLTPLQPTSGDISILTVMYVRFIIHLEVPGFKLCNTHLLIRAE